MRFRRGEVVFYRLKIRSKIANVAEVDSKKCEGGDKTLGVDTITEADLGTLWSPPWKGTPRLV